MVNKFIEFATHLLHVLALIGCGVLLSEGKTIEAFQCAIIGAMCVVILAAASVVADSLRLSSD